MYDKMIYHTSRHDIPMLASDTISCTGLKKLKADIISDNDYD